MIRKIPGIYIVAGQFPEKIKLFYKIWHFYHTRSGRTSRVCYISDEMMLIFKELKALRVPRCNYVFHVEGRPLNYGTIQLNYREAQRKGNLPYSGTHILRHGMAKLARKIGGLDAVLAMTGHKDIKLADHYSKSNEDDQKEVSKKVFEKIKEAQSNRSADEHNNVINFSRFANKS